MPRRSSRKYTLYMANNICEYIALGKTLDQALKECGELAPTKMTVYKWLEDHEQFREKYERARQYQADTLADRMIELGQEVLKNPKSAAAYRVAGDIVKWQAEVRNRRKYGARTDDKQTEKPMDADKIRSEIKRLEHELGVKEKEAAKIVPLKAVGGESS